MSGIARYAITAIFGAWLLAGCAAGAQSSPPPTHTPGPSSGDLRLRPADEAAMVYVPDGTFQMGSDQAQAKDARKLCQDYSGDLALATCQAAIFSNEMPARQVTLSGYWIDKTEVTNGQYRKCLAQDACSPPAELGSYTRESYFEDEAFAAYPVIWVTWQQAADYCAWAGARLPTEAEWEYAARGPFNHIFPWGDTFDGRLLNYCDTNCPAGVTDPSVDDGFADTAPVGSYPGGASWIGALGMAGNVREWVADWYGLYAPGQQVNPSGPESGASHIPKGGAWLDRPDDTRSANRGENEIDYVRHKVGFRCAATLESMP